MVEESCCVLLWDIIFQLTVINRCRYPILSEVTDLTCSTIFGALDSKIQRRTSLDVVMMKEKEGQCKLVAAFEELLNEDMGYKNSTHPI
ncbi:hypothetical protein MKW94_007816 [Papaver nudicaule]|uniref:Uncharacterized protein n=1 Tax=Papaver nudicaule TaxID=74823 RepID=A0AA41VLJ7_PAPNU|nr:hypothetical protein [Papaver nudicaule]